MQTETQQGIEAMRRGDKVTACKLLQIAVQQNPQDINALLWLSGAVNTDQERLQCLQQVIKIDPGNAIAAKGIAQLISCGAVTIQVTPVKTEIMENAMADTSKVSQLSQKPKPIPSPIEPNIFQPTSTKSAEKPQRSQPTVHRTKEEIIFKVNPSPLPVLLRGGFLLILIALLAMIFQKEPSIVYFLLVPFAIFLIAVVILRLIQRSYASYTLTYSHLIVQKGVLNRNKKTIPVSKIQDISYRQPIFDRLFGLGDVIVESAGERGAVYLTSLHNCVKMSEEILKVVQLD